MRITGREMAEGGQFIGVEHDPAVRHRAADRDAKFLPRQYRGRACDAADGTGPGAIHRRVVAVSPARAEVGNRPSVRRADNAPRLGGDQALVVKLGEDLGLDDLRLHDIGNHGQNRFTGIDHAPLREGDHIPVKTEAAQVVEKRGVKLAKRGQVEHILLVKMEIDQVVHDLLQPRKEGKASPVRVTAVEHIKGHLGTAAVLVKKIAISHGQLVEIHHHGGVIGLGHLHLACLLSDSKW